MPELHQLASIPTDEIKDRNLVLVVNPDSGRAYKSQVGAMLSGYAKRQANNAFNEVTVEKITGTEATFANLLFASGGGIDNMVSRSVTVSVPVIASNTAASVNVPFPGAALGMGAIVAPISDLATGLSAQAVVTATDMVKVKFFNLSASATTAASVQLWIIAVLPVNQT